ncbi:MAG: S8 family serine peptidase [Acidobacteria bacterium]|nr:S8 family serine peptidase [Acidobacteriota bacterium]
MNLRYFTPLLVFVLFSAPASHAQTPDARPYIKGEVVVEIKPGATIDAINARQRTKTIEQIYGTNFYRLATPANKSENKWRKRLSKDEDVLSAELNPLVTSPSLFGRSTTSFPDGFANTGLQQTDYLTQQSFFSWLKLSDVQLRSRGTGVVIALIDTGIDRSHSLLSSKLWRDERSNADLANDGFDNDGDGLLDDSWGWDFVDNDNDPTDKPDDPKKSVAGHGTFIAGLIATLAPEARLLPIRAFGPDGMGNAFTVAAAVKYAADHGAQVINLSLGSSEASALLQEAITDARSRGIVVVAAVGNDNDEVVQQFPAKLDEVIAVAAIDLQSKKASFSNFGAHVDVCAPGVKLISAYPNEAQGGYAIWSGTSFAAPLAAAEAALLLALEPRLPDAKKIIEDTAVNIDAANPGFVGKLGKGRIDPLNALQSVHDATAAMPYADIYSEVELLPTAILPEARGKASISVAGSKQLFRVEGYFLSVRTTYRLFVDGVPIGDESKSANLGSLTFEFSTEPGKPALSDALNPVTRIGHVELRDHTGRVAILQGDFKTGSSETTRRSVEKKARLLPTTATARLGGQATVRIFGDYQELKIEAEGLQSGAVYRLVVDGFGLGARAVESGFIRAFFSTSATGDQFLPANLRPVTNLRRVEVYNSRNELVLRGEFTANPTAAVNR